MWKPERTDFDDIPLMQKWVHYVELISPLIISYQTIGPDE